MTRKFATLLLVQMSFGFAFATFFLLPKFMAQELGATPMAIGSIAAAHGMAGVFAMPIVARALRRVESARHAMVVGSLFMAVSAFAFTLVDDVGLLPPVLRFVQGIAAALVFNAGTLLATELAPQRRLAEVLGIVTCANLTMNALAPVAAELIAARLGYGPVFVLSGVIALFTATLAPKLTVRGGLVASEKARLWPLLRQRTWQKHALVLLMSGLGFGLMFTFSQPFALSVGQENLRGFFVAFACTAAVVRLGLGRMVDRVGHRQIAFVALLFYGLVVAAMCTLTVGRLEALGALFGLVHGLFIPAFTALVVHESEPHERGSVLALFNGFFNLGSFVVVVLAVPVTRFGYPVVFAGSGAAIALSPLLLLRRKA